MERLLALLVLSSGFGCTDVEDTSAISRGIVRGEVSPDGTDPAVVFLSMGCSGTLISPRVVLTARHCTSGLSAASVDVAFGNAPSESLWIDAVNKAQHGSSDVALLTLAEPAPTDWIPIGRVALTDDHIGKDVRIVGFGQTGENVNDSGVKRRGETVIHSVESDVVYIGEPPTSHTCYGDSGGPYFTTYDGVETVFGVTSFGTSLCETGLAGGMRVDVIADWIDAYIEAEDPAQCTDDGRCAADCAMVDLDCCDNNDGTCTDACGPGLDVDCQSCAADGFCVNDCPDIDADCCDSTDGVCDQACGPDLDSDCGGDGGDGGGGDNATSGGCQTGGAGGGWLALGLLALFAARRRRLR